MIHSLFWKHLPKLAPDKGREYGVAKRFCSLMDLMGCLCPMRYKVKASMSVMQPYRCSEQKKAILSKMKEPCPSQHRGDNLGSETKGESMVKGIYTDGNSTTEIYTEVAYFLSSYVEKSDSHTSGVVGVVMVNVMLDNDSTVVVVVVVDSGRS